MLTKYGVNCHKYPDPGAYIFIDLERAHAEPIIITDTDAFINSCIDLGACVLESKAVYLRPCPDGGFIEKPSDYFYNYLHHKIGANVLNIRPLPFENKDGECLGRAL